MRQAQRGRVLTDVAFIINMVVVTPTLRGLKVVDWGGADAGMEAAGSDSGSKKDTSVTLDA